MGDEDEADEEDIDQVLAAVDVSWDQAVLRERLQAQRRGSAARVRTSK